MNKEGACAYDTEQKKAFTYIIDEMVFRRLSACLSFLQFRTVEYGFCSKSIMPLRVTSEARVLAND